MKSKKKTTNKNKSTVDTKSKNKVKEKNKDKSKKNKKNVSSLNKLHLIVIVVLVFVFIFSTFFYYGFLWTKQWLENIVDKRIVFYLCSLPEPPLGINCPVKSTDIFHSSFTDVFSGDGWIDKDITTAYHDFNTTAFTFPPIGNLTKTKSFYYEKPEFTPQEIPLKIKKINSEMKQEGIPFSFGGNKDDWVVVYGTEKGDAYRIKGNKIINISHFFGQRLMSNGFKPVILKADDAWYIFREDGIPKLIKLFENQTGEIKGVIDLTSIAIPSGTKKAFFNYVGKDNDYNMLRLIVENENKENSFWKFVDHGFNKSRSLKISSLNINNYSSTILSAIISEIELNKEGAEFLFFLSNDGENWTPTEPEKETVFTEKNKQDLFWRIIFIPDNNTLISPFLSRLRLDYTGEFLY